MVARSPGSWRTMIGLELVPVSELVNAPLYVPPRSQTVSPGRIFPPAPPSALARSHGRSAEPSFPLDPAGDTYHLGCGSVRNGLVATGAAESAQAAAVIVKQSAVRRTTPV